MEVTKKLLMSLLLLLLTACVTAVPEQQLIHEQESSSLHDEKAWYAVRFSISRDKALEPDWYLGTLIGGEFIAPVLEKYQQKITFWRVHRRAVDDKTGHVFSFIFYSSQADAAIIYQQFKNNKLLASLRHQGLLEKIAYDSLYHNDKTEIAHTSDPVWPEKIRSSWPYFIMGASQMWLEQIKAFKEETQGEPDIRQHYRAMQNKLTELWRQQGQHALIHHLNALYAYQPMLTRF